MTDTPKNLKEFWFRCVALKKAHDSFCKFGTDLLLFRKQPRLCFAILGSAIWKEAVAMATAKPRDASARSESIRCSNTQIAAPHSTTAGYEREPFPNIHWQTTH
ncbi:MAG: hypothetical protein IPM60_03900 [Rhodospirillales bacterium]|nr:hypothetical protein [Rhodospirillales bacterium]